MAVDLIVPVMKTQYPLLSLFNAIKWFVRIARGVL